MKNITLSADETLIKMAREKAQREHTTLNNRFREWLEDYTESKTQVIKDYDELMHKLEYVKINKKYSREEMNAR